jgi:hypothetical protein
MASVICSSRWWSLRRNADLHGLSGREPCRTRFHQPNLWKTTTASTSSQNRDANKAMLQNWA